jgi:hypothetical protein
LPPPCPSVYSCYLRVFVFVVCFCSTNTKRATQAHGSGQATSPAVCRVLRLHEHLVTRECPRGRDTPQNGRCEPASFPFLVFCVSSPVVLRRQTMLGEVAFFSSFACVWVARRCSVAVAPPLPIRLAHVGLPGLVGRFCTIYPSSLAHRILIPAIPVRFRVGPHLSPPEHE